MKIIISLFENSSYSLLTYSLSIYSISILNVYLLSYSHHPFYITLNVNFIQNTLKIITHSYHHIIYVKYDLESLLSCLMASIFQELL